MSNRQVITDSQCGEVLGGHVCALPKSHEGPHDDLQDPELNAMRPAEKKMVVLAQAKKWDAGSLQTIVVEYVEEESGDRLVHVRVHGEPSILKLNFGQIEDLEKLFIAIKGLSLAKATSPQKSSYCRVHFAEVVPGWV